MWGVQRTAAIHLLLAFATTASANESCTAGEQQQALVEVFSAWGGSHWHNRKGWLDTSTECEDSATGTQLPAHCCWHGIKCCISQTCSEGQRPDVDRCDCQPGLVLEIALSSNRLEGDFSSLNHNVFACGLSAMLLSNNGLLGNLGPNFPVYRKLTTVDLMSNSLQGTLPRGIGQISSLSLLFLSGNSLVGAVPSDICGNNTKLFSLALDNNNFSGRLDLSRCKNLGYVVAMGNNFSEIFVPGDPASAMPNLKGVFLEENGLRGILPSNVFISLLPNLEQLGLSSNMISGPLPVMSMYSFKYVVLYDNRFAGPVPESWGILARPGLRVSLHVNYLSCCGTDPLSPDELIEAADLRIDDVYSGVDYSTPILPSYLELTDELENVPVLPRQSFKANGMRCPKLKLAGQEEGPSSILDWNLDPSYYMFAKCKCAEGLQLVNLTRPGRIPYLECRPPQLDASDESESWEEAYPWAVVIIVVVGCTLLITILLGLYLYKGTEVVQRLNNLKKRMHGIPTSGPFTAVVTDIQGWTALSSEHPELSKKVLSVHNAIIRRARWNNFGSTHETEGDSFTMVFHDAQDAVAFCLQVQQMLSLQQWPSPRGKTSKEPTTNESDRAVVKFLSFSTTSLSETFQDKSRGNKSFTLLNPRSSSKKMEVHHSMNQGTSPSLDIRVRMGLASGSLCPEETLHGHPTIELAKEVSDAAAGGQILMEGSTFTAIKDVLGELGTVDAQGMHLDRLRMRRVLDRSAFFLCRFIAPAASTRSEDAIVLDMGTYTKPGQEPGLKHSWSPPGSLLRRLSSKPFSPTSRLFVAGTPCDNPADPDELHLYQVLSPSNAECAKSWGSALRLKGDKSLKDSLSKGYFDAPGTLFAPLGISNSSADVNLPPVTIIFASVEDARVLSNKDMRLVEQRLLACTSKCLNQVQGDGYLCRVFGNLKLMLCFSKPEAALAWSCAMQECMMSQPWPRSALKEPFKEVRDQHGQLIFRGPRLKIGINEGRPDSIQPDHMGRADYHGDCVNSAARFLEGMAQGGMIVCEQDVARRAAEAWAAKQLSSGHGQTIETTHHTVQPPHSWSPFQPADPLHLVQEQLQPMPEDGLCHDSAWCSPKSAEVPMSKKVQSSPQSAALPVLKDDGKPGAPANSTPCPRSEPLCTLHLQLPEYPSAPQPGRGDGSILSRQYLGNIHVFWMGLFRFKGLTHMKSMVHVLQDKLAARAAGFAPRSLNPGAATLVSRLQPKGPSVSTYLVPFPVIECPPRLPEPRNTAASVQFEIEGLQQGSEEILSKLSGSSSKQKQSAQGQ